MSIIKQICINLPIQNFKGNKSLKIAIAAKQIQNYFCKRIFLQDVST